MGRMRDSFCLWSLGRTRLERALLHNRVWGISPNGGTWPLLFISSNFFPLAINFPRCLVSCEHRPTHWTDDSVIQISPNQNDWGKKDVIATDKLDYDLFKLSSWDFAVGCTCSSSQWLLSIKKENHLLPPFQILISFLSLISLVL